MPRSYSLESDGAGLGTRMHYTARTVPALALGTLLCLSFVTVPPARPQTPELLAPPARGEALARRGVIMNLGGLYQTRICTILTLKSASALQLPTPQGSCVALDKAPDQASVSPSLQWAPSSWSRSLPTLERKPHPFALSVRGAYQGACPGATQAAREGRSQEIRAGRRPPQPQARRRRGRRLPPETRSRCTRRCQHSWKVTPGQAGGRGYCGRPLPDVHCAQLPPG